MNFARLFLIVSIVSVILAGCQTAPNSNASQITLPAATEAPAENEAYPQPAPAETGETESNTNSSQAVSVYPELKDGDEVDWNKAVGIILTGQVTQVLQTHDLKVFLTLKDGRTLVSTEPVIDELMGIIDYCGDPCKGTRIATE